MSWLIKSSIGRKLVMSITGLALILFMTFHMSMNLIALFSQHAYNEVCEFLGANWYALVGTMGLAFLFIVHIVYAFILTFQNRRARGKDRYSVVSRPKGVEWASQNMLVLGIIVIVGLALHLYNFWANMQLVEIANTHISIEGIEGPADGAGLIRYTFSQPVFVVLYVLWLVALWFHMCHGFWSSLQTIGWNSTLWFKRIQRISVIYTTLIILGFLAVVFWFYLKSICGC